MECTAIETRESRYRLLQS